MAEHRKVAEVGTATDVRKPIPEVGFPDGLLGTLRSEEHYPLTLVEDEPLDQHQAHESLAEANSVA